MWRCDAVPVRDHGLQGLAAGLVTSVQGEEQVKLTARRLRQIIVEAVGDDQVKMPADLGDIKLDSYYVIKGDFNREVVCRLDNVISTIDGLQMAVFKTRADGDSRQRFDVWQDRVVKEASDQEAADTEERWASEDEHMSRTIDTSHEGT